MYRHAGDIPGVSGLDPSANVLMTLSIDRDDICEIDAHGAPLLSGLFVLPSRLTAFQKPLTRPLKKACATGIRKNVVGLHVSPLHGYATVIPRLHSTWGSGGVGASIALCARAPMPLVSWHNGTSCADSAMTQP